MKLPLILLLALAVVTLIVLAIIPPIAQDPAYHLFVDTRSLWGIPNAGDVLGNGAFVIAGLYGIYMLRRYPSPQPEQAFWWVFFLAVMVVAFGSGYYHLNPNNHTLVWDRLPMTLAFMSLFALVIMERIHRKAGIWLFPVLLLAGIASVWYWDYTESLGRGDLRPYAFIQFFPIVAIIFILTLFPAQHRGTKYVAYTLGWYILAKLLEHYDQAVFELTHHLISGHTIKHVAAAIGAGCMAGYYRAIFTRPSTTVTRPSAIKRTA